MIQGDFEKAAKIYQTALEEYNVFNIEEGDPLLVPSNHQLACLIYNFIKCNAVKNAGVFMSTEVYKEQGLQNAFLRNDEMTIKLFTILSKMQSPLAKGFFEERQKAESMFDLAVKQVQ